MNRTEHPDSTPILLRPWISWVIGIIAVVQTWAFVDHVIDRDWFLAGCFGLMIVAFVVETVVLLRHRRRSKRQSTGGANGRQPPRNSR